MGGKEERGGPCLVQPPASGRSVQEARVHIGAASDQLADKLQTAHTARSDGRRIAVGVVAGLGSTDPCDGMKRGVPGALIVRVRPGFEQVYGQFEVAVF